MGILIFIFFFMRRGQIFSDEKGELLVFSQNQQKFKIFSIKKKIPLNKTFSRLLKNEKVTEIKINQNNCFFKRNILSGNYPSINILFTIISKNKKLGIIEPDLRRKFLLNIENHVGSTCNLKGSFFFYSKQKIHIVDQTSGEFVKEITLKNFSQVDFSICLNLSKCGKYLILQDNSIYLLDLKKGNILKKISKSLSNIFFLNLWKGNRLFYSTNDGAVENINLNQKKIHQIFNFSFPILREFSTKIETIKGFKILILSIFSGNNFYFFIFEFGKKFHFRYPFSLYINEKSNAFCFLRPRKNLVIVLSKEKGFIPVKIKLKEFKKKDFKKKSTKKKKLEFLSSKKKYKHNVFLSSNFKKKRNKRNLYSDSFHELYFKFGNWKKNITHNIILNSSWLIKNIIRFKLFYQPSENLQFFQRRNISKTFYNINYEWIEPFLDFFLKGSLKKKNLENNFLIWGKEIVFHYFVCLLENSIIKKNIQKITKKEIQFSDCGEFFGLYVNSILLKIQEKKSNFLKNY